MGFASFLLFCAGLCLVATLFLWLDPARAILSTMAVVFVVAVTAGVVATVELVRASAEEKAPFLYDVLQDAGLVPADAERPEDFDLVAFLRHVAERLYESPWGEP